MLFQDNFDYQVTSLHPHLRLGSVFVMSFTTVQPISARCRCSILQMP